MGKRGCSSYSPKFKKTRSENSNTPATPVNQERNVLNEELISLYKKSSIEKENVSKEKGDPCSGKQLKSENAENSKTPARDRKKRITALVPTNSTINFEDVGGMLETVEKVQWMFLHHQLPKLLKDDGKMRRGILLHGPPGCGKTHFARAIAGELNLPILEVQTTDLVHGISGESENKIREAFEVAIATGRCILFFDNIQAICSKTLDNPLMHRMGLTFGQCFDELADKDKEGQVMVVATAYDPHTIIPGLRGGQRFSWEVPIGLPNKDGRHRILEIICKNIKPSPKFSLEWLAKSTPGYVGGDLNQLVKAAQGHCYARMHELMKNSENQSETENQSEPAKTAGSKPTELELLYEVRKKWARMKNIPQEIIDNIHLIEEDFEKALRDYVPFARREGFMSVDNVTWDDVGALTDVKLALQENIVWPVKYSEFYEKNKLSTPMGILLFGPKGCGKTLVAKAIANECNLNFLSVSGPELLSMYVGESERAIRITFERAQNSAPCVLFFDEFDALCPPRSSTKENAPVERVVNQLLAASDGTCSRQQVFLVAATNRLDKIDSAMLRPGRLDQVYYVGLPTPDERVDILRSLTRKKTKLADDLQLEIIAHDPRCEEFSGADLSHLVRTATRIAMKQILSGLNGNEDNLCNLVFELKQSHFDQALDVVKPSISEEDRRYFKKHRSFCHAAENNAKPVL